MLTNDLSFVKSLTPLQEHFLKKFLLEEQLTHELHYLSKPESLKYLGPPFSDSNDADTELPLLRFFFANFAETFPLIATNTKKDQIEFWKDTVMPFVDSFNTKNMSEGVERSDHITKRHQVNQKLLSSLLLFYNSTLISKRDMEYLEADHLKSADQGKLHKLGNGPAATAVGIEEFQKQKSLEDYKKMVYVHDISVNIVAVDIKMESAEELLWLSMRMFSKPKRQSRYSFVIQVTRRTAENQTSKSEKDFKNQKSEFHKDDKMKIDYAKRNEKNSIAGNKEDKHKKYRYESHFVSRTYLDFQELESLLRRKYPGLMTTDVGKLPKKLKNDDGVKEDGFKDGTNDIFDSTTWNDNDSRWSYGETEKQTHREPMRHHEETRKEKGKWWNVGKDKKEESKLASFNSKRQSDKGAASLKSKRSIIGSSDGDSVSMSSSTTKNTLRPSVGMNAPKLPQSDHRLSPKFSVPNSDSDGVSFNDAMSHNSEWVSHSPSTITKHSTFTSKSRIFYREKLRLALRGYLHTLLAKPEITHCEVFTDFLNRDNFARLSPVQHTDYLLRMELEKHRVITQHQFQVNTAGVVYQLTRDFDQFKHQLVRKPHQLTALFEELSVAPSPETLSPLLRTFVEWCKLEVAATIYQLFLTQDNLSEWLQKCRKFHRLFPYRLCYGILKYTNPVAVMLRLVDVLLVNVPTLKWGDKKVHSLLSMTFVMLLDEDLEDYVKERERLMTLAPLNDPRFKKMVERINNYVINKDLALSDEIKAEAHASGEGLLVSILKSDILDPRLGPEDTETICLVEDSYKAYESLQNATQLEATKVYVNLRQLWQLEVRSRDKQLLKQLWQEPELTKLIKKVLTMFFQPMMAVMKKCDVHLAFRDFQHFMDDLMVELEVLDSGDMYYLGAVEMFDRFKELLDRHEPALWRFLHNAYVKDDQHIFLGIVEWIESFLSMLRCKFSDPDLVTLDIAKMKPSEPVDQEKFVSELDERIRIIVEKRRILQKYLREAGNENTDIAADILQEVDKFLGESSGHAGNDGTGNESVKGQFQRGEDTKCGNATSKAENKDGNVKRDTRSLEHYNTKYMVSGIETGNFEKHAVSENIFDRVPKVANNTGDELLDNKCTGERKAHRDTIEGNETRLSIGRVDENNATKSEICMDELDNLVGLEAKLTHNGRNGLDIFSASSDCADRGDSAKHVDTNYRHTLDHFDITRQQKLGTQTTCSTLTPNHDDRIFQRNIAPNHCAVNAPDHSAIEYNNRHTVFSGINCPVRNATRQDVVNKKFELQEPSMESQGTQTTEKSKVDRIGKCAIESSPTIANGSDTENCNQSGGTVHTGDDHNRISDHLQSMASSDTNEDRLAQIFSADAVDFGVSANDIADFNLVNAHEQTGTGTDDDSTAHRQVLQSVAALDRQLSLCASGELRKVCGAAHPQLSTLLRNLNLNSSATGATQT